MNEVAEEIDGSILIEEARALLSEVEGNKEEAKYYRLREIQRIVELRLSLFDHPMSGSTRDAALNRRDYPDLERRIEILKNLSK